MEEKNRKTKKSPDVSDAVVCRGKMAAYCEAIMSFAGGDIMWNPVVARDLHFRVGGISPADVGLTLPGSGTSLRDLLLTRISHGCACGYGGGA